jgi:hypothetical protein
MKRMNVVFLITGLLCIFMVSPAFSEIISQKECSRDCAREFKQCKKTETAASAVDKISCHEIREMCMDRCRNITGYVDCKEKCDGDRNCLSDCQKGFKDNVDDYRPYLEHHRRGEK